MPGVYAHYRFGRQVLPQLPPKARQTVRRFRRLYDMGLYGGDVFLFHSTLFGKSAAALAETYGKNPDAAWLEQAWQAASTEGAQAYCYGLIAHWVLEDACADVLEKAASATALAGEFDRYLLELDGLPLDYDRSAHMQLTRGECVTVSGFYPPATATQTYGAIRRMRRCFHFMSTREASRGKKWLCALGMGHIARYFPESEPTQEQLRQDSTLLTRYSRAVKAFPEVLTRTTAGETGIS